MHRGAAEFDALEESAGVRDRVLFVSGRLQDVLTLPNESPTRSMG